MWVTVDGVEAGTFTPSQAGVRHPSGKWQDMPEYGVDYFSYWSGEVQNLSGGVHTIEVTPEYVAGFQIDEEGADSSTEWLRSDNLEWTALTPSANQAAAASVAGPGTSRFELTVCVPQATVTATATATEYRTSTVTASATATVTERVGTTATTTLVAQGPAVAGPTVVVTKPAVGTGADAGNGSEGLAKTGIGPWTPWLALGAAGAVVAGLVLAFARRRGARGH